MEVLAKYDPYTIEEVEFFVQKKTKYTSLKSIIVSLIILGLTVALNFNSVRHLWIPRAELPVFSSERKMSEKLLTSSYVCVIAKNHGNPIPNTNLSAINLSTNKSTKYYSLTNSFDSNQEILNATQGRQFGCYDIGGTFLNQDNFLKLSISAFTSEFDFIFKTYTPGQIMGSESPNSYYHQTLNSSINKVFQFKIKKIRGIIYDSLMIDYEPEEILGLSPTMNLFEGPSSTGFSLVEFSSQFNKPFDTVVEYVLKRENIGDILGKLLSWFSTFVLIAAFGVSPILNYNYKVELCKKLYDNNKLNNINVSLLSYLKYLVSRVKKNLFDEDILPYAFDKLETDVDLLNLMKKQALMKKLIKENQYINQQPSESLNAVIQQQQINVEELFIGNNLPKQLLSQDDRPDKQHINDGSSSSQVENPLVTNPDERSKKNFITRYLMSFDDSDISISLISNKGEGYKTSWNTVITVICVSAVLWFIIFAGIFQMSPSYSFSTVAVGQNDEIIPKITINPEDILFRAQKKSPAENFVLVVTTLDVNDNIIQNLTLLTGAACQPYMQNLNETGSDWMCLEKPVTLLNDGKQNMIKLGLRLRYPTPFGFSVSYIQTLFWQYDIINNFVKKSQMYSKLLFSANSVFKFDGQAILFEDGDQQLATPQGLSETPTNLYWTCNKAQSLNEALFKGITFEIKSQFIKIQKTSPTIWDVIDTAWGIVVLAFSVILSKLTRHLNVKEREKIIRGEQNENRNDIVAIISTQYKLIYQVFYNELKQVKYFYKTRFEDFSVKDR